MALSSGSESVLRIAALLAALALLTVAAFAGVLAVVIAPDGCTSGDPAPSTTARDQIPPDSLPPYHDSGTGPQCPGRCPRESALPTPTTAARPRPAFGLGSSSTASAPA